MSRWVTVANRLPFSLGKDGSVRPASGGLVSSLSGVRWQEEKGGERLWVGCAPEGLTPADWPRLEKSLAAGSTGQNWIYQPVFAPKNLYDSYYNGICNDALWPLLHYQPELVRFDRAHWKAYCEINQSIATEILRIAREDDLVWVHDFHLFLVPKLIKAIQPRLRVGFFLHVPFPSSELLRQFPEREEILSSLLEADLVGFHDYSYLQHFCTSVLRILGVESEFLRIRRGSRTTRLGVYPVSIDTEQFVRKTRDTKVRALARTMERPQFVFLGVDRLDYMKGLDLKLMAYRTLLRKFPQYREKILLIQIAVPTRQGVPVYNRLARETAQLVGEINGEFSTPNWSPIQYIHGSVNNDQLVALYRSADALLVNSKRDGMNLVALEYIASQDQDRPGVVLISEFAGASSTLSHAISINPWDLEDTSRKMQIAMEMPKQEKHFRLQAMQRYLKHYTATDWAESFIADLASGQSPADSGQKTTGIDATPASVERLRAELIPSPPAPGARLAMFLDYDGTLVPINDSPELAVITTDVVRVIRQIGRVPWIDTIIISGRDSRFLEKQFVGLNVHIAAEHGAKCFDPATKRWQRRVHRHRSVWYPAALKIMSDYALRVPRSQIEKKHFAISWHYRQAPQEYAEVQARKLAQELELGLANLPVTILRGKKVVEVRAMEADKGVFASSFLDLAVPGTVALALGDDRTDEDLFRAVKGRGVSIRVSSADEIGPTEADYALASQSLVLELLANLTSSLVSPLASSLVSPLAHRVPDHLRTAASKRSSVTGLER